MVLESLQFPIYPGCRMKARTIFVRKLPLYSKTIWIKTEHGYRFLNCFHVLIFLSAILWLVFFLLAGFIPSFRFGIVFVALQDRERSVYIALLKEKAKSIAGKVVEGYKDCSADTCSRFKIDDLDKFTASNGWWHNFRRIFGLRAGVAAW